MSTKPSNKNMLDFVRLKVEMQNFCVILLLLIFNEFSGKMALQNFACRLSL